MTETTDNNGIGSETSGGLVSQIVAKIRYQPFLFVVAIAALLVSFLGKTTDLGSPDTRFVVVIVALLTALAIIGYFVIAGIRSGRAGSPAIRGKVKVGDLSGDTRLGGVRAKGPPTGEHHVSGEVDVKKASGGQAFGVDIGGDAEGFHAVLGQYAQRFVYLRPVAGGDDNGGPDGGYRFGAGLAKAAAAAGNQHDLAGKFKDFFVNHVILLLFIWEPVCACSGALFPGPTR